MPDIFDEIAKKKFTPYWGKKTHPLQEEERPHPISMFGVLPAISPESRTRQTLEHIPQQFEEGLEEFSKGNSLVGGTKIGLGIIEALSTPFTVPLSLGQDQINQIGKVFGGDVEGASQITNNLLDGLMSLPSKGFRGLVDLGLSGAEELGISKDQIKERIISGLHLSGYLPANMTPEDKQKVFDTIMETGDVVATIGATLGAVKGVKSFIGKKPPTAPPEVLKTAPPTQPKGVPEGFEQVKTLQEKLTEPKFEEVTSMSQKLKTKTGIEERTTKSGKKPPTAPPEVLKTAPPIQPKGVPEGFEQVKTLQGRLTEPKFEEVKPLTERLKKETKTGIEEPVKEPVKPEIKPTEVKPVETGTKYFESRRPEGGDVFSKIPIEGKVESFIHKDREFIVYKEMGGKGWKATDAKTGFGTTDQKTFKTKKEAIEYTKKRIDDAPPGLLKELYQKAEERSSKFEWYKPEKEEIVLESVYEKPKTEKPVEEPKPIDTQKELKIKEKKTTDIDDRGEPEIFEAGKNVTDFKKEREFVGGKLDKLLAEFPEIKTPQLRLGRDIEFRIDDFKATLQNPTYELLNDLKSNTTKTFASPTTRFYGINPKGKIDIDMVNQAKVNIISKSSGRLGMGVDPTIIKDYAIVGLDLIQKGFNRWADWVKKMVGEFGTRINPHLLRIWKGVKDLGKDLAETGVDKLGALIESKYNPAKPMTMAQGKIFSKDILNKIPEKDRGLYEKAIQEQKSPLKEGATELAKDIKEQSTKLARGLIIPVTSQLGSIGATETLSGAMHSIFKSNLRSMEFNSGVKTINRMNEIIPFLEKTKKLPREDKIIYDLARKNGDVNTIKQIESKHGMSGESAKVRTVLNKLASELGVEPSEQYWARQVKDYKGLVDYFVEKGDYSVKNIFEKLIREKEQKGKKLTEEQKIKLINNSLRGYNPGIRLSKIGNLKERLIDKVDSKTNKFYEDTDTALIDYIEESTRYIEQQKFFGKRNVGDLDESIGAFVLDKIKEKGLDFEEASRLTDLLKARFNERGTTGIVSMVKNASYISLLGSPTSAIRQLGDLAISLYRNGFAKTGKALGKSLLGKPELPLTEIGIETRKIAQEFGDVRNRSKILNGVFRAVGFTKADLLGKETLINATLENYRKQAQIPTPEFMRRLETVFGNEAGQVLNDFKTGKITDNVKLQLFNELSDTQPITLSEMPPTYLTSGNGRVFYMLKTFFIRRLDYYRNETFKKIANPKTRKEGIKNLVKLTSAMMLMETTADELINLMLGKETNLSDMAVDNILKTVGFSSWNLTEAKKEGLGTALWNQVSPPVNLVNDISKDAYRLKMDKSWKHIPGFGKIYYWWFNDPNKDSVSGTTRNPRDNSRTRTRRTRRTR